MTSGGCRVSRSRPSSEELTWWCFSRGTGEGELPGNGVLANGAQYCGVPVCMLGVILRACSVELCQLVVRRTEKTNKPTYDRPSDRI